MLQPSIWPVKSPMLGTGYLSTEVTKLRQLKLLQGRHDLSFFLTRCSGDAQELLDRRAMPECLSVVKDLFGSSQLVGV